MFNSSNDLNLSIDEHCDSPFFEIFHDDYVKDEFVPEGCLPAC
jgi:hypothetical protein